MSRSLFGLNPFKSAMGAIQFVIAVGVGLIILVMAVKLGDAKTTIERMQQEASAAEAARLVALWKQQERHDAAKLAADEAVKRYTDELKTIRATVVRPSDGLRGAAKAYAAGGGASTADADCSGVQHRATTLGRLLEEADELLGEGEGLAIESTAAAEQHAAEVRLLMSRVRSDRQ